MAQSFWNRVVLGRKAQEPNAEQGIRSLVEGVLIAADYIAAKGQNVGNITSALQYAGIRASPSTTYQPSITILRENNSEVSHAERQVPVPEAASALSATAWKTATLASEQQAVATLNAMLKERANIGDALVGIADAAALRPHSAWKKPP